MKYVEKKRWLLFGLPFTFTQYTVTEEFLTIDTGLLSKKQNDCYMYKIVDTTLSRSFMERLFGLGTIHCYGGDVTNPTLVLEHIKNAQAVKDFILQASEEARMKKRTYNMQNIGAEPQDDCCGDHHIEHFGDHGGF